VEPLVSGGGGGEGTCATIPGSRIRGGDPPSHRCNHRRRSSLTLGIDRTTIEAGDDKRPQEHPEGACKVWRGVFPSGFPHHVEDLGPSHHFARIPTAGGAASAAAALPRIVPAGGAVIRDYTVSNAGYEYGYEMPCERARSRFLPAASCTARCPLREVGRKCP
jgi:hypothetical protein